MIYLPSVYLQQYLINTHTGEYPWLCFIYPPYTDPAAQLTPSDSCPKQELVPVILSFVNYEFQCFFPTPTP